MMRFSTIKFISATIAVYSLFISYDSIAKETTNNTNNTNNSVTIYSDSIMWEDNVNREKLLATVTQWDHATVQSLFYTYHHPEDYQLPKLEDTKAYNLLFINAFWGPLNNPFNQYPRPTKAFVFLDNVNKTGKTRSSQSQTQTPAIYYMAPIIKNRFDGNDYVFDNHASKPILLNDWIARISMTHGHAANLRFNICAGYGSLPTDSCLGKSYQDETKEIDKVFTQHSASFATEKVPSAHRDRHEDWQIKAKQFERLKKAALGLIGKDIYSESIDWNDVAARNKLMNTISVWPNDQIIQNNFNQLRDIRYFEDSEKPDFLRRLSWLYPDDGCWTRAAAVIKDLFGPFNSTVNQYSRPSKVFAFGNLCVNTSNAPYGSVAWWYHTAPVVRDRETNQSYVLDPAVNPYMPLTLEKWIAEITAQTGACAYSPGSISTFNICNGYGTGPFHRCQDPEQVTFQTELHEMLKQPAYQDFERARQVELGRDTDKVLGDFPPWLN